MSSDQITTQRDAALAQTNDARSADREQEIARALCSQLDRVLDELWQFADDPSARTANSVALAQLALRLCRLYPQPTPNMRRRIALGEQVLELHGFDATYRRDALLGDACVRMTRLEAALLHYLVGNRDRIVSREELMKEVWQKRLTGSVARTVDIHVHRLRRKLGDEFAECLETIRNVGYTFSTNRRESRSKRRRDASPGELRYEQIAQRA